MTIIAAIEKMIGTQALEAGVVASFNEILSPYHYKVIKIAPIDMELSDAPLLIETEEDLLSGLATPKFFEELRLADIVKDSEGKGWQVKGLPFKTKAAMLRFLGLPSHAVNYQVKQGLSEKKAIYKLTKAITVRND